MIALLLADSNCYDYDVSYSALWCTLLDSTPLLQVSSASVSPSLRSPPPLLLPPTSSSSASLHNHLHLTSPTILCCSNFKELVWIEYSFSAEYSDPSTFIIVCPLCYVLLLHLHPTVLYPVVCSATCPLLGWDSWELCTAYIAVILLSCVAAK